ncbi:SusC/RagA family TonB-linked outer membrane protein [Pedobacter sp. MC2016-24]|uniref:SusC/RagA family TonB-linked outer membrane protein n=1 Tax=Pedobacter sp. MC2016-24 TaxID=2780090 RepID=UPI0018812E7E|nr:SusC/RagA family TonB-linked outer membrane protein [Pedobacter sp. MC2016-24]MBE9598029.1 SusC/RagA family TonB-linked outer membrane protein [Pedobacter sp. MC2016-24]
MYKIYANKIGMPNWLTAKLWLIMRLTTVILIATLMQVSAKMYAQRVTLNQKRTSLEKIFREIHNQTGYDFLYDKNLLDTKKPVSIVVSNEALEVVLQKCLANQSLAYIIDEKAIIIRKKEKSIFEKITDFYKTIDVSGKVTDENGQPLTGATVSLKNGKRAVTTGKDGLFYLQNVEENELLLISYIGYINREVKVAAQLNIRMILATNELAEVMVNKGYYTESQKLATGNTVTVTAKDIEKQPVINPLLALQGRVAGLQITQTSGVTNGSMNILIRGRSSLDDLVGNNPLYIIDGIPYQSALLMDPLGNNGGNGVVASSPQGNPLNYINPNDIASISVLKDADATAIYGSRGGNGVILITTKKGQIGQMSVGVNMNQGFMQAPKPLKLMNTQQYLEMRREAFKNDGVPVPDITQSPGDPNYDVNGTWSQVTNTDWQKQLMGNFAAYTNANVSLSGGNEQVQYAIRGTYNRQGSLAPGNFDDQRGGLNFNITAYSKNKRLKIDFSGSSLKDNNQNSQSDLTPYTLRAPNAPESFKPDGTLNFGGTNSDNANNPYAYTLRTYSNKTDNSIVSLKPSYQITKGLSFTANLGFTNLNTNIKIKQPVATYSPLYLSALSAASIPTLINTINQQKTWIIEPQLSYELKLKDLKFSALAGTTFQKSDNEGHYFLGTNFVSDVVIGNLSNAGLVSAQDGGSYQYKYNAVYSRLNANLSDKYILNFTARRDGSSKFGPGKQFGNFYSAAAAWIFSSEKLIGNNLPFLSLGKLRTSYGTSGNDNIGNYAYYDLYTSRGANTYQGLTGFAPRSLSNPDVAWEKNAKLEFAVDLGFLKDRIVTSAAYYRNRSSNQLINYTIPSFTGFSSIPSYNFPATVQNSGLEFTLNTRNVVSGSFEWTSDFNISFNRNKLLKFENLDNSNYSGILEIGQPVNGRGYAWIYKGIDPNTGLYTALKKDGTVGSNAGSYVSLYSEYQITTINTLPKYFGGFNNTFRYKSLQLAIFLQFVKQVGRLSLTNYAPGFFSTELYDQLSVSQSNVPVEFMDRWQKPGDPAKYQRYTQSAEGLRAFGTWSQSDASYVDASYIRAKNITLSYQLPKAFKDKLRLKSANINLTGQNLFTITPYQGRDPETQSYSVLPPLKVFVLGVQINF